MKSGYQLISTGRSDQATFCEHCGRVIIRFAYIKSRQTNREYRVGLDCMHTLCKVGQPKEQSLIFKW